MDPLDPKFKPPAASWSEESEDKEGRLGFIPEFVRKMALTGLGALFMTEEGIRSLAGQLKLPKEVLGQILSQADRTKDEIGRVISEEVRRFLQSERLREEIRKVLARTTVEIKAEIRLVPNEEDRSGRPELKLTEFNARRTKRAKKD